MSATTHYSMPSARTFSAKPADIRPEWYLVDATDQVLGRLAARIAIHLRGKHKPTYTPHMDTGDYIIVINANQLKVTGNKEDDKVYYRHTGYPGGIKSVQYKEMMDKHPERILELAVKRMLPKGPLGRRLFNKLKVYAGSQHPHAAQHPKRLDIQASVTLADSHSVTDQKEHTDAK